MTSQEERFGSRSFSLPVWAYLLAFAVAITVPMVVFSGFLLMRFASAEQANLERSAARTARQIGLIVDGELLSLQRAVSGLAASSNLHEGDLEAFHEEASRYVSGRNEIILLRDYDTEQLINTQRPWGAELPPAIALGDREREAFAAGRAVVSNVFRSPISGEPRVAVALPVSTPRGDFILAVTIPTTRLRDVILPAVPAGWIVAIGGGDGNFVARSQMHDEVSGMPARPEYFEKATGLEGAFEALSLDGTPMLAGYYRSRRADWLIAANIPIVDVEAPVWQSLGWLGAYGTLALALSGGLAAFFGRRFDLAARALVTQAKALAAGQPVRPLSTSLREFDVIGDAFSTADEALRQRTQELEAVLTTVPAAVWFTYDREARNIFRNRFALEYVGIGSSDAATYDRTTGTPRHVSMRKGGRELTASELPLQRALAGEEVMEDEYTFTNGDGTTRIVLISARAITDAESRRIGAVAVGLDITDRKRGEEQRRLLVNELNHRVKNTLAIVQSIALQTVRNSSTMVEAGDALQKRLVALGRAHDVLNRESWEGAAVRSVIEEAIAPLPNADRIRFEGPAAWLPPSFGLSLTLIIHELATNAAKYGALSSEGGSVELIWSVDEEPSGKRRLSIRWQERDGPAVRQPDRQGFGTRLIARLMSAEDDGMAIINYAPDGLVCTLKATIGSRADLAIQPAAS